MNDVRHLTIIPPPKMVHLHANLTQSFISLFDLNLKSAMGELERVWMVE